MDRKRSPEIVTAIDEDVGAECSRVSEDARTFERIRQSVLM